MRLTMNQNTVINNNIRINFKRNESSYISQISVIMKKKRFLKAFVPFGLLWILSNLVYHPQDVLAQPLDFGIRFTGYTVHSSHGVPEGDSRRWTKAQKETNRRKRFVLWLGRNLAKVALPSKNLLRVIFHLTLVLLTVGALIIIARLIPQMIYKPSEPLWTSSADGQTPREILEMARRSLEGSDPAGTIILLYQALRCAGIHSGVYSPGAETHREFMSRLLGLEQLSLYKDRIVEFIHQYERVRFGGETIEVPRAQEFFHDVSRWVTTLTT